MKSFNSAEMFSSLARSYPAFAKDLEGHISEYGEIIPHVLAGDLSAFIVQIVRDDGISAAVQIIEEISDFGVKGDEDLRNVIAVSIVENLIGQGQTELLRQARSQWVRDLISKVIPR